MVTTYMMQLVYIVAAILCVLCNLDYLNLVYLALTLSGRSQTQTMHYIVRMRKGWGQLAVESVVIVYLFLVV